MGNERKKEKELGLWKVQFFLSCLQGDATFHLSVCRGTI